MTSRIVPVAIDDGEAPEVGSVQPQSQDGPTILEEVCLCHLGEVLAGPVGSLLDHVRHAAQDQFESLEGPAGTT